MDPSLQPLLHPDTTIIVLSLLFVIIFLSRLRRKPPYPPGPRGWPVIGNMLMMKELTHRGLARLAAQYGSLIHLKMGGLHMVAVSSPAMAREVLQAQDNLFSNRPATVAISYLTYNRADMVFAHYGPFWRQMRKIFVTKIFSQNRARSWRSVTEEVDLFIGNISTMAQLGSTVNIGHMGLAMMRRITYRIAFGSISERAHDEFAEIIQQFSKLFGEFSVADFIPWLGWINGPEFKERLVSTRASLDGFIDTIIDDHMAKREKKSDESSDHEDDIDIVDQLMEFCREDGWKSHGEDLQSINLSRDNIKAIIMDVMFGGTETVASAVEWGMAELMNSREELKKVQQELIELVGLDRRVNESDLHKLTYLKCVVKETLRLHPPIPLLFHETAADCAVAGYKIPAKACVLINIWAINRDKAAWDDADSFKPSRFLDLAGPDLGGSNFEFIPFGSGRRSCPAMKLALHTTELTLAHLCHCFTWELVDGVKPGELDMNDAFGLTSPRASQLAAIPSHRLWCSVF